LKILTTFLFSLALATQALAGTVVAHIDLSQQSMTVSVDGKPLYTWPVSTARAGKTTPTGTYGVQSMRVMHYSSLYNNAPMPHSIFFRGNYAIHGTNQVSKLGSPASAGCVRLHPTNAETLFNLVRQNGTTNTRIQIVR